MISSNATFVFVQAGRAGPTDLDERVPELRALRNKTIAVFGLGCIGAPSTLEFARAGVGELRILDHDTVDPGTIPRWPVGLSAAGLPKAMVLRDLIARDYPYTKVVPEVRRLGAVRLDSFQGPMDEVALERFFAGASLVYDTTAEIGIQQFLSARAWIANIPYISVDGTQGGWGARVCRIDPAAEAGCWICYQRALDEGLIPQPPEDSNGKIQPAGCGDPTFTGAGFDMASIALAGVRMAVATLCRGEPAGYPSANWDAMTIAFRQPDGTLIAPSFATHRIPRNPECPQCAHH